MRPLPRQNIDSPQPLLGRIRSLLQRGLNEDAISCCRQVLRHSPDCAEAFYLFGKALSRHPSALVRPSANAAYRRAIALQPDFPKAYHRLTGLLIGQGELEEALTACRDALHVRPNDSVAKAFIANIHYLRGETAEALDAIQPLLNESPVPVLASMAYARLAADDEQRQQAVALLEQSLATSGTRSALGRESDIRFLLGHLLGTLGEYDRAFEHVHVANFIAPHRSSYDFESERVAVEEQIALFSEAALQTLPRSSNVSEVPVFIVGMPRSGTTLLEQTLAAHPRVYGGGELDAVTRIVGTLPYLAVPKTVYPYCMETLTSEILDKVAGKYLRKLEKMAPGAQRVTDKTTLNFAHLGLLSLLFPRARVLHCTRDPLDTCVSCYFQNFGPNFPFIYDLESLGVHYGHYRRLMDHWRKVLDISILDVSYEEIVADHEAVTRRIIEFCGVEWSDACLRFHELSRPVLTASIAQVRRPIYTTSVGRHRHYEHHLEPLMTALGKYARGYDNV
jgi:tetratricopeptide (TPR) repeat protein